MLVKVKKSFIDKYTKQLYNIGDTFEADAKRIDEIKKVDKTLIETVKEKETKKKGGALNE